MEVLFRGTAAEIRAEMQEFLGATVATVAVATDAPKAEKPKRAPKAEQITVEAVRETAAKLADTTPAPVAVEIPVLAPAKPEPVVEAAPVKTVEQAQSAVAMLVEAKGVPVATALLSRFGAKRLRDVKPEMLGELVRKADLATAGKYDPLAAE